MSDEVEETVRSQYGSSGKSHGKKDNSLVPTVTRKAWRASVAWL